MDTAQTLLDKATQICGSRYALAKRLNVDQSQLSKIAHGKEGIAPGLAARLAAIAGDDPTRMALEAVAARERDPRAREELARLFKLAPAAVVLATSAVFGLTSPPADAAIDARTRPACHSLCIM